MGDDSMMVSRRSGGVNPMVPIVLVVATVAGIVVSRFLGPIAAAGTVTAALFGMMLLGKPRMLVFVYFGWATIMNMPVGFFQYTDEILVVLLYAFLVMETITGKRGRSAETRGFRRAWCSASRGWLSSPPW